ncbi:MAG TPA: hypothetical protein VF665_04785 [Longimicrobium sp.]|jgi:uncharacterized protein (DUF433 family)|uniref:hypothetical protein n=1 Tax=Longimicrobium sp. TaxID=2029185 RepID=UPI002EDA8960
MLGTGIYSPADAAALLKAPPQEVRRWAFGYSRVRAGTSVTYDPLIRTELPELDGQRALTFVELVELMFIKGFRKAGAPWKEIHEAARVAARILNTDHPFAMRTFFADPGGIYAMLDEAEGGESLVRLVGHGQHAFTSIVKPYLGQLEFDPLETPTRWWPLGKEARVVLDPLVSFGAPVLADVGVPTATLADVYQAEREYAGNDALRRVAWLYTIPERQVQLAVEFEQWRRAA